MDKKSRALKVFENESFRLLYTSLMKSMIRQSRALAKEEKNESMMEKVERRKKEHTCTMSERERVFITCTQSVCDEMVIVSVFAFLGKLTKIRKLQKSFLEANPITYLARSGAPCPVIMCTRYSHALSSEFTRFPALYNGDRDRSHPRLDSDYDCFRLRRAENWG